MAYEIPVTQARAELADLINRVVYGSERVVVTRHGKPLVALVSADDLRRLDELDRAEAAGGAGASGASGGGADTAEEQVISSVSSLGSGSSVPGSGGRQRFGIAAEHRGTDMR
ncbi:type II toxin-antitoxin system prevent-host-death family antitoxin [Streptomyces sp. p1417]|uniref:Antitoxin n=1 Tax=Streptomyces typhae TaxID=2681492 RepID=A0A6L6X3T2_9ACTN|nr:type II toxin-antitoxin system Phd/YefM family antitoxin [Streptomyces typhae]MVO88367.1 type II toxin-antitoxin system prevent-host-death family antitoxin [Streptomyces typhae]